MKKLKLFLCLNLFVLSFSFLLPGNFDDAVIKLDSILKPFFQSQYVAIKAVPKKNILDVLCVLLEHKDDTGDYDIKLIGDDGSSSIYSEEKPDFMVTLSKLSKVVFYMTKEDIFFKYSMYLEDNFLRYNMHKVLRKEIDRLKLSTSFFVPDKYLYFLPVNCGVWKNIAILSQNVKGSSLSQGNINSFMVRDLLDLAVNTGYLDLRKYNFIKINDDKIAIIDTEDLAVVMAVSFFYTIGELVLTEELVFTEKLDYLNELIAKKPGNKLFYQLSKMCYWMVYFSLPNFENYLLSKPQATFFSEYLICLKNRLLCCAKTLIKMDKDETVAMKVSFENKFKELALEFAITDEMFDEEFEKSKTMLENYKNRLLSYYYLKTDK